MAGIGFVLRKLLDKDNLSGVVQAYLHAVLASSGPWLFTVIALGSFFLITGSYIHHTTIESFRIIILYNFCFSLVFTASITVVSTRFLADLIYSENVDDAPGMLLGTLALISVFSLPLVSFFYIFFTTMDSQDAFFSVINFILISGIWMASIFISALKQYTGVTFSFIIGLLISVFAAVYFADVFSLSGMLAGFNLGLSFIFASLVALVFSEYPKKCTNIFAVIPYFNRYWDLALGGLAYSLAIWVDKWIMWFAPEATSLSNSMVMYPHYDGAMFVAYLTVVPAMATFLITQETSFFEHYVKFYRDIQKHVNYEVIEQNHRGMINCISFHARNLIIMQGCICVLVVLAAPMIIDSLGMNYIQIGIFRFGVLGATFQVFTLFLCVLLSYFDHRKGVCLVQGCFFISNLLLSYLTRELGFSWYGYGYFLSTVISFLVAAILTERHLRDLPYQAFVVNNTSVQ